MIFLIILAVVVSFVLAWLVVKFLPLKLRWLASVVLLAISVLLIVMIYKGIMGPIEFNKKKQALYKPVIENLKIIRDAQIDYYEVMGTYADKEEVLISFIDTAQRAIIEMRDSVIKENKGSKWQPVYVPVEIRIKDTIAFEPILDRFKDRDYKNMFNVPGVDGKKFILDVGTVEKIAGLEVPVFQVRTDKESILKGLDRSLVKQELEAITADEIKGADISVGSLSEVTTGGNWPPSYDKGDAVKKD